MTNASHGRKAESEQHYLLALEAWKAAGKQYIASECETLMRLADLYLCLHRVSEAESLLIRAAALAREVATEHPETGAEILSLLGAAYRAKWPPGKATATLHEAVDQFARLSAPLPAEGAFA